METQIEKMKNEVKQNLKNWWINLLIGLLLVVTGIWTFTSPLESYLALAILFSIAFLITGILEFYFAFSNRESMDNWGWHLAFGLMTALAGVLMIFNPEISMITLPFYVGFIVLFRSTMAIGWATDLKRRGLLDWGNLMVMGVLGVLFSFVLIWNPAFAGMTIVFWTGFTFLTSGIISLVLAFKLRKAYKIIKNNN